MREDVAAATFGQPQCGIAPAFDLLREGGALGRGHHVHWRPDAELPELHRRYLPRLRCILVRGVGSWARGGATRGGQQEPAGSKRRVAQKNRPPRGGPPVAKRRPARSEFRSRQSCKKTAAPP